MPVQDPDPMPVPAGLNLPGLSTRDLTREVAGAAMAPFLVVSRFRMTGPVFPPHPHAGFSVATYILPDSPTGFWNQDSLGTVNRIAPGALHWTVAGAGVVHEETPERAGRVAEGFQIWIDHPAVLREVPPQALHVAADAAPVRRMTGITRRVVAGRDGNVASPLVAPVEVQLVEVVVDPGTRWTEDLAPGMQGFLWVLEGEVRAGGAVAGADTVVPLSDGMVLQAKGAVRLMRFAGRPSDEVPVFGGPFVGSTAEQLARFRRAYQSGGMGRLVPFDQAALDRQFDAGAK